MIKLGIDLQKLTCKFCKLCYTKFENKNNEINLYKFLFSTQN